MSVSLKSDDTLGTTAVAETASSNAEPVGAASRHGSGGKSETQTLPCVHCGEPTRVTSSSSEEREHVFCCAGCRGAYQLIHGWGLEDFYALRQQAKITGAARPANEGDRYEQFDSAAFLGESLVIDNKDGSRTVELALHGLHCSACSWLIENAAQRLPGLLAARVKMSQHTVRIVFDPAQLPLSMIARFFDRLGYRLAPYSGNGDGHIERVNRRHLIQIATAGFLAANAMWIAIALYAGEFSWVAAEHRYFLGLAGTLLGLAAVLGPGRTFLTGAFAALKTRTPHMDLPVALGLTVGSVVGAWNALWGVGHVYFDSLAILVFLLLIGRWIQFRQQRRASRAVDLLLRLTPQHASLVREDGSIQTVLASALVAGDEIEIASGESIPADGQIVRGKSKLDRSLLTGESQPVACSAGDDVEAGTVNTGSPLRVRVSACGSETRIGKVMASVESATEEKTPIVLLADRIGGVFVVAVMVLATIAFGYWLRAGVSVATANATALLIVACPCALALATPLAIAVGLGRAARLGILIRDGKVLQQLARRGQIWFDKTGTLTEGIQRVVSLYGSEEGLAYAALLERGFRHPIADAIVQEAALRSQDVPGTVVDSCSIQGGISGSVSTEAHSIVELIVGNLECLRAQDLSIGPSMRRFEAELIAAGNTAIFIAVDGQVVTLMGISDPVRKNARQVIERLNGLGWKVGMLSGDHPLIAQRIGDELGIPRHCCHGGLSPEDKLTMIRVTKARGDLVAMVGDGANDAAALAAADVGIAVRGGAEVSLQAAPIFIASGKLKSLCELVGGSTRTTRLIWATFSISLCYNLIAVGMALAGWISPLVAAILMPISSVSVLAMTLVIPTFKDQAE